MPISMRWPEIMAARDKDRVELRVTGPRWRNWVDTYHFILRLSWPRFFALLTAFFLAINLLFATAYWAVPDSIDHARPGVFSDRLFFSIETLATVGYGEMAPSSTLGHVIASLEILVGLMSLAVVTGLVFARFSKPTARVTFSDNLVIRHFDGRRVLMLRVANERKNRMVAPTAHLWMVRRENLAEGDSYYRIHDLALLRQQNPVFALTWTLIHAIDESSPLHGLDHDALLRMRIRITASISGHDETIAAQVHALHEYEAERIYFDHRLADIVLDRPDGTTVIDMGRFHDVEPEPWVNRPMGQAGP